MQELEIDYLVGAMLGIDAGSTLTPATNSDALTSMAVVLAPTLPQARESLFRIHVYRPSQLQVNPFQAYNFLQFKVQSAKKRLSRHPFTIA